MLNTSLSLDFDLQTNCDKFGIFIMDRNPYKTKSLTCPPYFSFLWFTVSRKVERISFFFDDSGI